MTLTPVEALVLVREALNTCHLACCMVDDRLMYNEYVEQTPELHAKTVEASQLLGDLYQLLLGHAENQQRNVFHPIRQGSEGPG